MMRDAHPAKAIAAPAPGPEHREVEDRRLHVLITPSEMAYLRDLAPRKARELGKQFGGSASLGQVIRHLIQLHQESDGPRGSWNLKVTAGRMPGTPLCSDPDGQGAAPPCAAVDGRRPNWTAVSGRTAAQRAPVLTNIHVGRANALLGAAFGARAAPWQLPFYTMTPWPHHRRTYWPLRQHIVH